MVKRPPPQRPKPTAEGQQVVDPQEAALDPARVPCRGRGHGRVRVRQPMAVGPAHPRGVRGRRAQDGRGDGAVRADDRCRCPARCPVRGRRGLRCRSTCSTPPARPSSCRRWSGSTAAHGSRAARRTSTPTCRSWPPTATPPSRSPTRSRPRRSTRPRSHSSTTRSSFLVENAERAPHRSRSHRARRRLGRRQPRQPARRGHHRPGVRRPGRMEPGLSPEQLRGVVLNCGIYDVSGIPEAPGHRRLGIPRRPVVVHRCEGLVGPSRRRRDVDARLRDRRLPGHLDLGWQRRPADRVAVEADGREAHRPGRGCDRGVLRGRHDARAAARVPVPAQSTSMRRRPRCSRPLRLAGRRSPPTEVGAGP